MTVCRNCGSYNYVEQEDSQLKTRILLLEIEILNAEKKLVSLGYKKTYIKHDKPCMETNWVLDE